MSNVIKVTKHDCERAHACHERALESFLQDYITALTKLLEEQGLSLLHLIHPGNHMSSGHVPTLDGKHAIPFEISVKFFEPALIETLIKEQKERFPGQELKYLGGN